MTARTPAGIGVPARSGGSPVELDWVTVHEITQLHFQFGQALDSNDWSLYRSCLADPIRAHYEGAGLPLVTVPAADWVDFVIAAVQPQQTVHYFTNLIVRPAPGGNIGCRFNHQSCHRVETAGAGDATYLQHGTYHTVASYRDDRWVISSIHHSVAWASGNPALVDASGPDFQAAYARVYGAATAP